MTFSGTVEGRNADESVDAAFHLEVSVGVGPFDFERSRGDAGFIGFLVVGDGDLKIFVLCPAGIHAVKHAGPVAGLGATCASLNGDVGVIDIGGGVEEREEFEGSQLAGDAIEGLACFAGGIEVIEFLGEFAPGEEILVI